MPNRAALMVAPHLLLLTVGFFSFLFGGCRKQPRPLPPPAIPAGRSSIPFIGPPEVTSESEEGFHDLVFYIEEHKTRPDGAQTLRAAGTHKGHPLGLEITLGPTWRAGSPSTNFPLVTYQGTVAYRSTGPEGDAFLRILDELYGTKLAPKTMGSETRFAAISLGGDPRDLRKGAVKIKLFFESDGQDDYAELFTNIELAAHRLEVREKDESYRSPIVRALRAH